MNYLRPLDIALVQALGVVCILAAVWAIKDGWHALGAFGVALMTVSELVGRRNPD